MASAAYSDAKVRQRTSNLRSALASVRRFARALGLTLPLALALSLSLGVTAVSVADHQAAALRYNLDPVPRRFDAGTRNHVQLHMVHVNEARLWLEQIYLERRRRAMIAGRSDDENSLSPSILDISIIDGFEYSDDSTLQYHDVSGVEHEHSLLPSDYIPGRPDRSHRFGLDTALPPQTVPGASLPESSTDAVPSLTPDVIAGEPNQELGLTPGKDTGVGASIDAMSAQSISAQRQSKITAQDPKHKVNLRLGVRSGGESESHIEQVVTVGNRGALTDDTAVGLTGPDPSGRDSLIGRGRTETTALDENLAVLSDEASNINELRTLYGGIYGPVSFRERRLRDLPKSEQRSYNQAQAVAEERRMSHYLHETMGLMGTQEAISNYLRPDTKTQHPVITQENFFDFLHRDAPSLLARRGRHYFYLTAPDGKDAQGDEVLTFAHEQGTFIQYSFMYLKARYGERNQGIFIEGTPRDLTVSEED